MVFTASAHAQIMDNGHKVDTLSMKDRISIRTNALEWMLLTPNIGIEYDLSKLNYGHWAMTLDARCNWNSSHTYKPGVVYNLSGARLGVRYYYRMRKTGANGKYPQRPTNFLKKIISPRTSNPHHPTVAFYRGAYVAYNKYSIMFGSEGSQGSAITAGFSWGFTKPLYSFRNGNTIDFEGGISAGFAYASRNKYVLERESNCYRTTETKQAAFQPIPVVSDLRLGFVYRVGNYPSTKKYRWRYDCDLAYQSQYDDMLAAEKNRQDSIKSAHADRGTIFEDFMRVYNEQIQFFEKQETKNAADQAAKAKADKAAAAGKAKADKAAAEQKAAEEKAAKKQSKNDKNSKDDSTTAAAGKDNNTDSAPVANDNEQTEQAEQQSAEQPATEQTEQAEQQSAEQPATEQTEQAEQPAEQATEGASDNNENDNQN